MIVETAGAELHFTLRGEGPTCLVPSAIGSEPYERQMPAELDRHLRMVFVDLRGGGRSSGDPTRLTFDLVAEDLEAIRRQLGVERVAVLGHSMLGALAIEYARRRPASVSHVMVVGAPPSGDLTAVAAAAEAFFASDASVERRRVLAENLAGLPPDASPGQRLFAETPKRFFDPRFAAAPFFVGASARPALLRRLLGPLTAGWEVTSGARTSDPPLWVAHGRFDYTVPFGMWGGIVERLPNATWRRFERSGHQPFLEEPGAFVAALLEWMAANPQ